jgi:hypothetical protein
MGTNEVNIYNVIYIFKKIKEIKIIGAAGNAACHRFTSLGPGFVHFSTFLQNELVM